MIFTIGLLQVIGCIAQPDSARVAAKLETRWQSRSVVRYLDLEAFRHDVSQNADRAAVLAPCDGVFDRVLDQRLQQQARHLGP